MPDDVLINDIFHYTKSETALKKILPEQKLRLGQMVFTNDPRETKRWNISKPYLLNPDVNQKKINLLISKVLDDEVHQVMKEEWKVLCFTLDHQITDAIDGPLEQLHAYYYDNGYAHPSMWAHYAENHHGVCLWFDGNKLDANLNKGLGRRCKILKGKVHYDIAPGALVIPPLPNTLIEDISALGAKNAARKYVFDHYEQFFLRKHSDWESEVEFRWLVHSRRRESEYVSIGGAIKGVLVGADFPDTEKPLLIMLCKELKISAGQIRWENGVPMVTFDSIYKA
jgi:hypothetical protein